MIDINGLNKADVLAALYNNAHMQGLGVRNPAGSQSMTREQAADHLQRTTTFDYLNGRVMKINLSGETFEERLYDRDNGQGKAARVIKNLRTTGSVAEII